jgi:hypothetical protein
MQGFSDRLLERRFADRHGSGVKRDEDYHNPEMPSRIEIGERCAVGSGNQFHQVE